MRSFFVCSFGLVLLASCQQGGGADAGPLDDAGVHCKLSFAGQYEALDEMLAVASVFVVGSVENQRTGDAVDLGMFSEDHRGCGLLADVADIASGYRVVFAVSELAGPVRTVVDLPITRCGIRQVERVVCGDAGSEEVEYVDAGCWKEIDRFDNCIAPEWTYHLPAAGEGGRWGMFFARHRLAPSAYPDLVMRFPVEGDELVILGLEGGRRVPLAEVEAWLLEGVDAARGTFR